MIEATPLIQPDDIDEFEKSVNDYLDGNMEESRFLGERLLRGIYGQRQNGLYMVRTKLPGGWLNVRQIEGYAEVVERFSRGVPSHISTRQDIQLYAIRMTEVADLLRTLASYGIATREAGGNTIRNITACGMAGVCPHEHVDVTPFLNGLAEHYIFHPLTRWMPRKFKIAFIGCEADCAYASVHDIAYIATHKDGKPGFRVLAGGGLGAVPRRAIEIESFVDESMVLPIGGALLALHDKYSDRTRRMRSRMKFLIDRFGEEGFIEKYREELARTLAAFDEKDAISGDWQQPEQEWERKVGRLRRPEKQSKGDLYAVPVTVPRGNLEPEHYRGLAQVMKSEGLTRARTLQEQNLILFDVPGDRIDALQEALQAVGLDLPRVGDDVVSCPGTDSCHLGITASQRVAVALSGGGADLSVRVNGCQNGCAATTITDIGLMGRGWRCEGRLIPAYTIWLGGEGSLRGEFSFEGPKVPAVRAPSAVRRIQESYFNDRQDDEEFGPWSRRKGRSYFDELLKELTEVREVELPFLIRDHGDSHVFEVNSSGVGECAGSKTDPVDKLLLDVAYEKRLRADFVVKYKFADVGECLNNMLRLSSEALLKAASIDAEENQGAEQLASQIELALPEDAALGRELVELEKAVILFRDNNPDELAFPALGERVDDWAERIRLRCRVIQAVSRATILAEVSKDGASTPA
jgi:sulfite reductase (ferredoxin)